MTWRLLYVRPQSEDRYHANLAERGMSAYVPKETVWRGIGIRRQPAVKPLLPGYVFADLTDEELADAAHLPDVLYIIKAGDKPATVPSAFVDDLRDAESGGKFDLTRKERLRAKRMGKALEAGERFKVTAGLYAGAIGEIARVSGSKRAEVVLSFLGYGPIPVSMDFADMQVIVPETEAA